MGNEKSDIKKQFEVEINHPRFSKSKIITLENQKYLQTSQSIDEQEYKKWKNAVELFKSNSNHLLVPVSSEFSRLGLCGHTGTVIVSTAIFRSTIKTIPIYSHRRFTIEMVRSLGSTNRIFGFYC
jgi:hypothetical protein